MYFKINWCSSKSDSFMIIFFLFWLSVNLFIGSILIEKTGGMELMSEKTEPLWAELNERAEAATSSYSTTCNVLSCTYSVSLAKKSSEVTIKVFSSLIFFNRYFNNISHGYRAAILKKKFYGCFCSSWLWLLLDIMKRCAEQCTMYRNSLSDSDEPKFPSN